jgi:hypothetical protein
MIKLLIFIGLGVAAYFIIKNVLADDTITDSQPPHSV